MGNLIAKKENRFMTDQIVELEEKIIKDFLKKNKYEYLLALGKGEFSQVIKAFSEKTQCLVAIKFMKQIKGQSTIDLQDLEKELKIVQNLKNERYVLQIVEKIQDDQQGLVAIVTELCNCNLTTILDLNQLDFEQVLAMTHQLLKGLLVLQEMGAIHNNIKPENILFSKQKNQFLFADYGLSQIMTNRSCQKNLNSLYDNLCYKSPEVVNQQNPNTITSDVFSIGQILVEAFLQRRLTPPKEWMGLKSQSLFSVIPSLQNSQQFEFVNNILSKMAEPNKNLRLLPIMLLQNLNTYNINEDSLKKLRVKKELRKMFIYNINDVSKIDKLLIMAFQKQNLVKMKLMQKEQKLLEQAQKSV